MVVAVEALVGIMVHPMAPLLTVDVDLVRKAATVEETTLLVIAIALAVVVVAVWVALVKQPVMLYIPQ
jgi:hypothetical protein